MLDIEKIIAMNAGDQQAMLAHIGRTHGYVNMPGQLQGFIPPAMAHDMSLAMDALPGLITSNNSGVPAYLTNYIDPTVIDVIVSPMKGAQIIGEQKKGDWTTKTALFPVAESAGEVSSYADYSTNGRVTANINWPQRQSYGYQIVSSWGEQELAMMGTAQIDWVNRLNRSGALIMNKFQNKTYFLGVTGLQNYGLLNDPSLSAPITPTPKAAGGFTWFLNGNPNATGLEVFADITKLAQKAIAQGGGAIDKSSPMKLCMSPDAHVALTFSTQFNVNVSDLLAKNFPNMTIETAVEYGTASGQLVQLIVSNIDGQDVGHCAFTEKMRAHAIIAGLSSWEQKKSGGTWGAIITQPVCISSMLGV